MPALTILKISEAEQESLLGELRRARYGRLLAIHILLLCAVGRTPTEIAEVLFCSRSSIYRTVRAYRAGELELGEEEESLPSPRLLTAPLRRLLGSLLKHSPQVFGWCRTRWSCAALALQLCRSRGLRVSGETVRRWLHQMGWAWKRAKLIARDDDEQRIERLAAIRYRYEHLEKRERMVFADELDIDLLPKVGYQWTEKGQQAQVWTPGKNQKRYLAGALERRTGRILHFMGERKNAALFLGLLQKLDEAFPAEEVDKLYVVLDNFGIHKARLIRRWLEQHPRVELLFLPAYCPAANPIERAFGHIHDRCTRNHRRRRLRDLVADVLRHLQLSYMPVAALSSVYHETPVTAAVARLSAAQRRRLKAS